MNLLTIKLRLGKAHIKRRPSKLDIASAYIALGKER